MSKRPSVLLISDFDTRGSGYTNIAGPLGNELSKEYQIYGLGIAYDNRQHPYNFGITRINLGHLQGIVNVVATNKDLKAAIIALDIPLQTALIDAIKMPKDVKHIGIFAVESDPLIAPSASILSRIDSRFTISQFGENECRKAGLDATHLPIPIDTNIWYPRSLEEQLAAKAKLGLTDKTIFFHNADANERKNTGVLLEAFADVYKYDKNARLIVVTRKNVPHGWNLEELAFRHGFIGKMMVFERGMPAQDLRNLYVAADCLVMPSKAEGLCCLPNTKVWTTTGQQFIQDIRVGDFVISHSGNANKVTEEFSRDYSGNVYSLQPRYGFSPIRVTPKHKVLAVKRTAEKKKDNTSDPSWISAEELGVGDFIYYPKPVYEKDVDRIKFSDYSGETRTNHPNYHTNPEFIDIDDDFLTLAGYYISEGCQTKDGLHFSFHHNETDFQDDVKTALSANFSISFREKWLERNRYSLFVHNAPLGRVFANLFGSGSHEKHLPEQFLFLPKEKLVTLLKSMYAGDGYYPKVGQEYLSYTTVSEQLAEQLQFVLCRLGIVSYLYRGKRGEYDVKVYAQNLHKLGFIDHEYRPDFNTRYVELEHGYLLPIKSVERFEYVGKVYNLEVENDNSYLLNGGIVHNCLPVLEAQSVGVPVMGTNCTGMIENLENGKGIQLPHEFIYTDPFMNGRRYFVGKETLAKYMIDFIKNIKSEPNYYSDMIQRGFENIHNRTVNDMANLVRGAING